MTPGRLRSIEGLGVPLLLVVTMIIGAWTISESLTTYKQQTDTRISTLENSTRDLAISVKELTNSTTSMNQLLRLVASEQQAAKEGVGDRLTLGTFVVWCYRNLAKDGDFRICEDALRSPRYLLKPWPADIEPDPANDHG